VICRPNSKGSTNEAAPTLEVWIGPRSGNCAFSHCANSIFSHAVDLADPVDTRFVVVALRIVFNGRTTVLAQFCAASSTLTPFRVGEAQFGVAKSTEPVLMRTATLWACCWPWNFFFRRNEGVSLYV